MNSEPNAENAVEALHSSLAFPIDVNLKDCLLRSYDGFSARSSSADGITTDRLLVSAIFFGEHRPELSERARRLYLTIGDTDTQRLNSRVSDPSIPSHEVEVELEDGKNLFSESVEIFLRNTWANQVTDSPILTLDAVVESFIYGTLPRSCQEVTRILKRDWKKIAERFSSDDDFESEQFPDQIGKGVPHGTGASFDEAFPRITEPADTTNPNSTETQALSKRGDIDDVHKPLDFPTDEAVESPEHSDGKGLLDLRNEYGNDDLVTAFLFWTENQGIKRDGRGAITSKGLFYFLTSWSILSDHPLGRFGQNITPDEPDPIDFLNLAVVDTVPYETNGIVYPYITTDVLQIFEEGRRNSQNMGESDINIFHLMAAILLHAHLDQKPGEYLTGIFDQTPKQLHEAFLEFVRSENDLHPVERWEELFQPREQPEETNLAKLRIASGVHFARNASDNEIGLKAKEYAAAIAELFRTPDDREFSLALFGHWGRGKTFLMEQVGKVINSPNLLRRAPEEQRGNYETIFFSAWKYPSRPEVWVHLYETTFAQLREKGWWRSIAPIVRAGINNHGAFKLFALWLALFVAALPKSWLFKYVPDLANLNTSGTFLDLIASGSILVFTFFFLRKFWTTTKSLEKTFLRANRHAEKLGLQATVGDDLRNLLKGWVGREPDNPYRNGLWKEFTGSWDVWKWNWRKISKLWLLGTDWKAWMCYWTLFGVLAFTILVRTGEAGWVGVILCALVGVFAFIGRLAFFTATESPQRIVLVVDDLDRCEQEHLLSIVESIKLLIEDLEVSRRVRLATLIEEDILKHAIWDKYQGLADEAAQKAVGSSFCPHRIIRENTEKLFTVYLRLQQLSRTEMMEIINLFADRENVIRENSNSLAAKSQEDDGLKSKEEQFPLLVRGAAESTPSAKAKGVASGAIDVPSVSRDPVQSLVPASKIAANANITLEPDERLAIRNALAESTHELLNGLGPRSIRAYMFRYQLARLLLGMLNEVAWTPKELAEALVHSSLSNYDVSVKLNQSNNRVLMGVVNEVS